jgi:hypothetical protein
MMVGLFAASGCATVPAPEVPAASSGPLGSPFSDRHMGIGVLGTPLILDRTDLRIGVTVQFNRFPTATELYDLHQITGLAHVLIALPSWPADYAPLQVLNQVPEQSDVIVLLPGYPPNREAAEAWNLLSSRLRIVVVVEGVPPNNSVVADLNSMRALERVIAQLDDPVRSGFERLQRPLSFRKLVP